MIKNILIHTLICVTTLVSFNSVSQEKLPKLTGPYLGQKPPGMKAEAFAPGVISKGVWEVDGVFAPGMKEFYFTLDRGQDKNAVNTKFQPTVIGFRQQGNVWQKFVEFKRKGEVTFSPDGQRLFMAKKYKQRTQDGWSERKTLGPLIDNKQYGIMRLSSSAKQTYVFDDFKSGQIRLSTFSNGERQLPVPLGDNFNKGKAAHPYIAPDESYIIWDSKRAGGFGDADLYISFKQPDGDWGRAINMGSAVNSAQSDTFASVTPNGKYLMFNRKISDENYNVDIYWVDAKVIEKLKSN